MKASQVAKAIKRQAIMRREFSKLTKRVVALERVLSKISSAVK